MTRSLLAILGRLPGLRPATPSTTRIGSRVPWNVDTLAVRIDAELIEIRVVALALPFLRSCAKPRPPCKRRWRRACGRTSGCAWSSPTSMLPPSVLAFAISDAGV